MFTGIVQAVGVIRGKKNSQLLIQPPKVWRARAGESMLAAGVCLTVSAVERGLLWFDLMAETLRKTTLWEKKVGDQVNLEHSLKVGDELGGHFVYGHVDGVGEVVALEHSDEATLLKINPPQALMHYLVPQGSITLDGVSLTVARLGRSTFKVSLAPYTLKHTTLGKLEKGGRVNIEMDMMAKYICQKAFHSKN